MSKERKTKIITSLLLLLSIVIGVSYAFFQSQLEGEDFVEIKIESKTIDVLTFNVANDFSIDVTSETFARDSGNISHDITATASLIANNKTNQASYNYYLYLFIPNNTLDYTQDESVPELLLNVYGPDKEEVKNISSLNYIEGKGYDITKTNGLITISNDEIASTSSEKATDEQWTFKITLVNLETNQFGNAGKNFTASVIMQSEPLEDASLAGICKNQELADCLVDNYRLDGSIIYHDGKPDTHEEENYTMEDGDDSYRYSGTSTSVHNYVCLDGLTEGDCSSTDLYRIIGFFKNDQKYEAKLIKASVGTPTELGDITVTTNIEGEEIPSANRENKYSFYWNSTLGTADINNNVNMWKDSNLNIVNLNNFYYNYIIGKVPRLEKYISKHDWQVGGITNNQNAKTVYDNEVGNLKLTIASNSCYNQGNISEVRACNQDNDLTYTANIGLMYVSDFMYATTPNNWSTSMDNYGQSDVNTNNWLAIGEYEWTISRSIDQAATSWSTDNTGKLKTSAIYGYSGARPCFYLTSNTKLGSGTGTQEDPYRLKFE